MYDIYDDTKITGNDYNSIHITPSRDTVIKGNKRSFIYSKGNVKCLEENSDEFRTYNCPKHSYLVLGNTIGNKIVPLKILHNNSYKISIGSFVAHTYNISMKRYSNYYIAHSEKGDSGYIWLSCCGNCENISLDSNEDLLLNRNNFIACHSDTRISNIGQEMLFDGPCIIMIQTRHKSSPENSRTSIVENIIKSSTSNVRNKLRNI
jgi:uncharacterized protein (AIM24 family)